MESYSYQSKDLVLHWKQDADSSAVTHPGSLDMVQFKYTGMELKAYNLHFSTGTYTDLQVDFKFYRTLLYNFLLVYPVGFTTVLLSWLSFWAHSEHKATTRGILVTSPLLSSAVLI